MLWVKAFHIIFVVSRFAGLFYLPRIFVNHAMATKPAEIARLKLMEGKLYRFVTPIGALAIIFGFWLWFGYGFSGGWLHAKTALVMLLALIWLLGLSNSLLLLWLIPLSLLVGLCFASLGLIVTALAPGYDFFMYYFTLVITPMVLLCGAFLWHAAVLLGYALLGFYVSLVLFRKMLSQ